MCCFQVERNIGMYLMVSEIYAWHLNGYQFRFMSQSAENLQGLKQTLLIEIKKCF